MEPVIQYRADKPDLKPVYACGKCLTIYRGGNIDQAKQCCRCSQCGKQTPNRHSFTKCKECLERADLERNKKQQERLATLPVEEYDDGPVYWADSYFADLDQCLEQIEDFSDPEDFKSAIIYPCDVRKAIMPSLVEFVEEQLYEQLDDQEGPFLSEQDKENLETVEKSLTAPTYWMVRENARLRRTWAGE